MWQGQQEHISLAIFTRYYSTFYFKLKRLSEGGPHLLVAVREDDIFRGICLFDQLPTRFSLLRPDFFEYDFLIFYLFPPTKIT